MYWCSSFIARVFLVFFCMQTTPWCWWCHLPASHHSCVRRPTVPCRHAIQQVKKEEERDICHTCRSFLFRRWAGPVAVQCVTMVQRYIDFSCFCFLFSESEKEVTACLLCVIITQALRYKHMSIIHANPPVIPHKSTSGSHSQQWQMWRKS